MARAGLWDHCFHLFKVSCSSGVPPDWGLFPTFLGYGLGCQDWLGSWIQVLFLSPWNQVKWLKLQNRIISTLISRAPSSSLVHTLGPYVGGGALLFLKIWVSYPWPVCVFGKWCVQIIAAMYVNSNLLVVWCPLISWPMGAPIHKGFQMGGTLSIPWVNISPWRVPWVIYLPIVSWYPDLVWLGFVWRLCSYSLLPLNSGGSRQYAISTQSSNHLPPLVLSQLQLLVYCLTLWSEAFHIWWWCLSAVP